VKEDEMNGAFSMRGSEDECYIIWEENLKEGEHWQVLNVDDRLMLKWSRVDVLLLSASEC
jgi:hypothetical protein